MAASIPTQLGDIEQQIDAAAEQLGNDPGVSAATKAVFEELHRKTREARDTLSGADEATIRESLIECEQAADSAKYAAEADAEIAPASREAVLAIHDTLRELKGALSE